VAENGIERGKVTITFGFTASWFISYIHAAYVMHGSISVKFGNRPDPTKGDVLLANMNACFSW
jgi:hypothetical protein